MSKRTILTTIIIPALLISGLIFVLVNNQREYTGELVLTHTALIGVNLRKRLCFYEPLSIGMVIDIVGHLVP